ncbi:tRNA (guanosine(37)-N1)-methyltransferase TrmD [bacterium]|nr:tRNA (guanosine(37)-N1)-methyltransferase TrmD [bacterium]|tara:strand:+ start:2169 stop:2840 length:672 start_codon:yes stop_codon:yes gene_type:complete
MRFHVITLFPDICKTYTDSSILGRAQKTYKGKGSKTKGKKIAVEYYNPRDFSTNKHKKVDDRPYGGGPGMVMAAEPILKAWQKAVGRKQDQKKVKTLIMSPRGKQFTNTLAKQYAKQYDHLVLISGRYEGIDARVKKALKADEVSVGDYVLTGGELPALAIIDSVSRQVPGVLGTFESLEDERVSSGEMYTRPEAIKFKDKHYKVPKVFLSGNHADIEKRRGK